MKITVYNEDYDEWLMKAWFRQNDGQDRGYWYNTITGQFVETCETKNTTHNQTGELVLLGWVEGDTNEDYRVICENCLYYNNRYRKECGKWDLDIQKWNEYPSFEELIFECKIDYGDVEMFKKEMIQKTNMQRKLNGEDELLIEWL